jgi:hypothetical protein
MRKTLSCISLFLLTGFCSMCYAQDDFCDSCRSLSIAICPTEMIFGYETMYLDYKVSKRFSLGIGAGHNFPLIGAIFESDEPVWGGYSGTTLRFNAKYFFKNNTGRYTSIQISYRDAHFSWYTFHRAEDDGASNRWEFHQSETTRILGCGIIFGEKKMFTSHIVFDRFLGIGLNNRVRNYTVYDYYNGRGGTRPSLIGNFYEHSKMPTVYAGFKIGYSI